MIFTIGYEGSTVEDFAATLSVAGVKIILDVRMMPVSRKKGFSSKSLSQNLNLAGIEYMHLGGLGDPKEGRDAARNGLHEKFQKIFIAQLETPEAQFDLLRACEIIVSKSACLLCFERDPNFCHRKIIADTISTSTGIGVRHLGVRKGLAKSGGQRRDRADAHSSQGVASCG